MAVAMTLSSTLTLLAVLDSAVSSVATAHGLGLCFALYAGGALFVTRHHHGVRVATAAAWTAILSVGVSFPVLFWGGSLLVALPFKLAGERIAESWFPVLITGSMILSSALGARWVAATLTKLTGRADRTLAPAMTAWGAAWPLVCLLAQRGARLVLRPGSFSWLLFYDMFSPGMVLIWQLPIGLAGAAWFLRCGAGPRPADALRLRA
jgi:hypothetical protein